MKILKIKSKAKTKWIKKTQQQNPKIKMAIIDAARDNQLQLPKAKAFFDSLLQYLGGYDIPISILRKEIETAEIEETQQPQIY